MGDIAYSLGDSRANQPNKANGRHQREASRFHFPAKSASAIHESPSD